MVRAQGSAGNQHAILTLHMTAAQSTVKINYLADHPQHLPELAGWLYAEWGQEAGSIQDKLATLKQRLNKDCLPLALVAVQGETLLGTASLRRQEVDIRPQYEVWLSTVYVHPPYRRRGIGEMLVRTATELAGRLGIPAVYLYTRQPANEAWYARLGWEPVERPIYLGRPAVIMLQRLTTPDVGTISPA